MCDVCFDPSCAGDICNAPKPLDAEEVDPQSASSSTASLSSMPSLAAGTDEVTALISSSGGWSSSTITYGFANGASDYPSVMYSGYNEPSQFLHFSDMGKDILRDAFDKWGNVSGLTLTETSTPSNAVIRVGGSSVPDTAWAYSPGTYDANGDIWFGLDKSFFSKMVATSDVAYLGSYEYLVSLHEIGHTLGLKHPHSGSVIMDSAYDGLEYTVMSYRSYLGGPTSSYTVESWGYPQSLMMLDLAAIQELYGVNYSTLAGNTTYTFDPNTGEMFIDGVGQGTPGANRVFRTLWDGNGTDLIDLSNYTTDLSIDLNAGAGIDLDVGGYAQRAMLSVSNQIFASKHVYMSLLHNNDTRSLIENATGGTGNDILVGNQAANVLQGGAGDDVVGGGLGNDTLTLGSGADTVADTLAGLNGDVVTDFNAAEDTVRVTGTILNLAQISINSAGGLEIDTDGDGTVEALLSLGLDPNAAVTVSHQGNDSVISFGATVDLPPVAADDPLNLNGGNGDDTLTGGTGDDSILVRYGSDTATGNAGADTFILDWRYVNTGDHHTITDLDFSEGDTLQVRFFGGRKHDIGTDAELSAFVARADVTSVQTSSGLDITLTESNGPSLTVSLEGALISAPTVTDLTLNGGNNDDTLIGGAGDDTILMRYGSDTATGNAGADTFAFDWRYVNAGDHHTITDLDFSEGDALQVRFFGGQSHTISTDAELSAFVARADVTSVQTSSGLDITLTDSSGPSLTFSLEGALVSAPTVTDLTLNGGNNDDTLIGGAGDDTILMRFGSDTATGNAGADTFAFDWRYVNAGDHHTITDLDFSEGDTLQVRFFGGQNHSIGTDAELSAFVARADVTSVQTSSGLDITLTDSSGPSLTFSLEGNLGTTSAVTSDPDLTLNGGNNDDILIGGAGDDTILMRFGSDTATGDAGADTFAFDWRYVNAGDHHTITDLDFSEGDTLQVRFFGGQNHSIGTDAELSAFVARADVTSVQTSNGLDITLTDSSGPSLTFQLSGWDNDLA